MSPEVDVVIVGAGPGGLTAGSVLSRNGLNVLVLERNDRPGGTSKTYSRDGFTFPAGPLGLSNPTRVMEALGTPAATAEPAFKRVRYLVHAFGRETCISLPRQELTAELCRLYPEEADSIQDFMRDTHLVSEVLRSTAEGESPLLGKLTKVSASDYLAARIKDATLARLLGSIGTGRPVFGFPLLAAMWDFVSDRGIWYPAGGLDSLIARMAAEIERGPSRIRLCSEVAEIIVRQGRARGVRLADGGLIEASAVVSNADFQTTFLKLVAAACQPPEWRDAVMQAPLTSSNLQVSLGVEAGKVDLSAFSTASRIIYRRGENATEEPAGPSWGDQEVDPADLAAGELEISLLNSDDPSAAPPGGAAVVIRTRADHKHFERYRPKRGKRIPEYAAYKSRLAGGLVSEASRLLPGLETSVVISDVATPLTFEEYGGRYAGAVAGWSQRHEDVDDYAVRPLVLTPIDGLYMAGLQAFSWLYWGGVPSAVLSGARAALAVLRGDGPASRARIPGTASGNA